MKNLSLFILLAGTTPYASAADHHSSALMSISIGSHTGSKYTMPDAETIRARLSAQSDLAPFTETTDLDRTLANKALFSSAIVLQVKSAVTKFVGHRAVPDEAKLTLRSKILEVLLDDQPVALLELRAAGEYSPSAEK